LVAQGEHTTVKMSDSAITWENTIKGYFTKRDIECMKKARNIDLGSYDDVKDNADDIYTQVSSGRMPKNPTPEDATWTTEKVNNFKTWKDGGFPQ